jgi:predicted pyridoxine 5'-phosphate oxidase superfamily flavin-nucleotide-binding protein
MNMEDVFEFMKGERLAVLSTASEDGHPEAALMGFAVTPDLEIILTRWKARENIRI